MNKFIVIVAGLFLFGKSNGQTVLGKYNMLPPSPEAAAFIKNINIPVSYYSGTPQISIPFYAIKSGGLEVPVSISYNASGIRVEEVSSWVGLGWNLNAGGQITRSIRGLPDESPSGYMNVPYNRTIKYIDSAHCFCDNMSIEAGMIESEYNSTFTLDAEPDLFSFSVMGYSGDFIYNQDSGKYILLPFQNIKIEGSVMVGDFTIILPNGVRCVFGNTYESKEKYLNGTTASYINGYANSAQQVTTSTHTTSWMLTSIIEPSGKHIDFSYTTETVQMFGRGTETMKFGNSNGDVSVTEIVQSFYKNQVQKPVLQKISGENGNVVFLQDSLHRLDLPNISGGSMALAAIVIQNTANAELKRFEFDQDYFVSPVYSMTGILDITGYAEEARRRLYLKSITERSGSKFLPPYEFVYNPIELPSRLSTDQDYWGYYNAKSNGYSIMHKIPQWNYAVGNPLHVELSMGLPPYGAYYNQSGADRSVDTVYNQARVLTAIKYPTGGSTKYYYEANDAAVEGNLNVYGGMEPPDIQHKSYVFSLLSNPMPSEPPYPLVYSGQFYVNLPVTKLKVVPTLQNCTQLNDPSCKLTVKIIKNSNDSVIAEFSQATTIQLPVTQGYYTVEVSVNGSSNDYPPLFQVQCQWAERMDSLNFKVGGLRIKKIVSESHAGKIARSFSYNRINTNKSSGNLEGIPVFIVHDKPSTSTSYNWNVFRRTYTSSSIIPLSESSRTVAYQNVTEYADSAKSSFKTEYIFRGALEEPVVFASTETGTPKADWKWQKGVLEQKLDYEKNTNSTYRLLSEEKNYYKAYRPLFYHAGYALHRMHAYSAASEYFLHDSTITILHSYPNGVSHSLTTSIKRDYNHKFLQSRVKTITSTGKVIHQKSWYPTDFASISGFNVPELLQKNIIQLPIKTEESVNGKLKTGTVVRYNSNGQPIQEYVYESLVPEDTSAHNPNVILTSNYNLLADIFYDATGNLKQMNGRNNGPVTIVWEYDINGFTGEHMNKMPAAQIVNADSNSVAYTSFERASSGNWSTNGSVTEDATSPMGSKCFYFSGANISKGNLNSNGFYIVSYWSKSGMYNVGGSIDIKTGATYNGWTYYEHTINGVIAANLSGTGYIDELRLYPKDAMMTTYSYIPSVGVSSQCDQSGRIIYYEYDSYGRLTLQRDAAKNILKKICYNYSGQIIDCGYETSPAWYAISSICEQNGGNNTGNILITERDMNPYSATYNQTRIVSVNSGECIVCNTTNCSGLDKKCINNTCEQGTKIYTGSVIYGPRINGQWKCYFHYAWGDGSTSPTYEEINNHPCSF